MWSAAKAIFGLILASCLLVSSSAFAQNYPSKVVRIIVPTAPGGGYDFIGRVLAEQLGKDLGQAFIVENRAGAGTLVGTQAAASAPPDGYTLLVGGLANLAFNSGLYEKLPYNPTIDFTPIALIGAFSYTLTGRKDLPQSSLRDLVAYAKANPGKLTIATAGLGTGQHIAAALFKRQANVDIVEVPYKGAQPAQSDVLGGTVDLFFDNTTTVRPFVDSGRVKAFAVSTEKRDSLLPNVPTGKEAGIEGLVLDSWIGLFVPSKTPKPVIEQLRAAVAKAMESTEVRKRMENAGWRVISMSPSESEAFVKSENQKWSQFIRQAGIKAE